MTLVDDRPAHLFTSDNAAEMGRRSVEARRTKAASQRKDLAYRQSLRDSFQRGHLATEAFETALEIVRACRDGKVPIRNASEAAALIQTLVNIARIESGEHTAASVALSVNVEQAAQKIQDTLGGAQAIDVRAKTSSSDVGE